MDAIRLDVACTCRAVITNKIGFHPLNSFLLSISNGARRAKSGRSIGGFLPERPGTKDHSPESFSLSRPCFGVCICPCRNRVALAS